MMFSHVTVGAEDLERAGRFYDAVLLPLGLVREQAGEDGGPASLGWTRPGQALPQFYAHTPFNGAPAASGNGAMVAFLAPSPSVVAEAYAAGLAAGGYDEGAPGPRPIYGAGYFGAYLRDPEGNKVHIVHRGDLEL